MSEYRLYRVLRDAEGKHIGNEYMGKLVTCKECKHWRCDENICLYHGIEGLQANDFCSYGERRE